MRKQPPRRRGRPKLAEPPIIHRLTLTLRPGEDDDLIAFFATMTVRRRPSALKQALRSGVRDAVRDGVRDGAHGGGLANDADAFSGEEGLAEALERLLG